MKTFKFLSTITNKIGSLTNRNILNNNILSKSISKENSTYDYEQKMEKAIEKTKQLLESIKLQNNLDKNNPSLKKNIDKLDKYLSEILNSFFELTNFNQNSFQYLIESKLIPLLTENINILYINTISNSVIQCLQKLIFIDKNILSKGHIKEEIIIMNTQIIGCIKKIIFEFKNILNKINIINVNSELFHFINNGIIPFMDNLFLKLIQYPNFYHGLINDSTTININLELLLFEILLNLLKFEHQIKNRTSRALIRKNLLRFINNFDFPNKKELMQKVINYLISNLIDYYQNFLLLSIKKIDDNYKMVNNFPLEINENDIIQITTDDNISYLQFFNILIFSSSQYDLKYYLMDLLYNNFLSQYILEEIINLSNDISYQARSTLLIEYIYFLSKYITNNEINELFFYFLFGFNLEQKNIIEEDVNININIRKIISKSNQNYESIRAFFTLIFESNNINQFSLLLKTLTNLAKNIPYVFMSEMVVPYYLFYLNKKKLSEKDFDDIIENLIKKQEQLGLLEIVKILLPQYFNIDPLNWINYFIKNIELNYERGINNINQMNISYSQNFNNDSSLMNKSDGINNSNSNNNISYYKNMVNMTNYSFSDYNNESIISARNDLNESLFGNQTKESENEIINISLENKFSYILNSITFASRVKFFEILVKKYKQYVDNKYEENLYLTEFFNEISSFPNPLGKGLEGQQIYNIYAGVTNAKKNNDKFFDISATGMLHNIKNQLDKKVLTNFTKEEINSFCILMNDNNNDLFLMTNDLNSDLREKIEFLKNIKLYNEIFKDFISNTFGKILTEESNRYWIKGIKNNKKINESE